MRRARFAGLMCLALATLFSVGCSRAYWRRNADSEAYGLIREKTKLDARWAPPRSDVIPSPLSRLYDPADPDFGALPPDDPYAHRYMNAMSDCDRIQGSDYWDKIGMGHSIENPAWVASLPPEVLSGPMLADQVGNEKSDSETSPTDSEPEELPFADRFAISETLRSWRDKIGFSSSAPAGRATIATANEPLRRTETKSVGNFAQAKSTSGAPASNEPATKSAKASASPFTVASTASSAKIVTNVATPAENPFAVKSADSIQLASFQDEDPLFAPVPDNETVPDPLEEEPPAGQVPDVEEDLSADPGSPETAPQALDGPDLAAPNPTLPQIDRLTLEEAVRLSYLHSREYQTAIEDVYLAALDLAFDRFQFDVRFLGLGGRPSSDLAYTGTPGGTQSLTASNRIGVRRLLPAGGQWLVELANQTIWLFSDSPNESGSASTLTFSFVQPLLFAAGRKVVLEDLTQSERNLLYAARSLARFRQQFFTSVVSNYLGLLQQIQTIANQEDNLRRLDEQVTIARENTLTGDALSRTQLESQQLQQVTTIRANRASLQNQLDNFKIQLGLPPDVGATLDTTFLEPFQLISSELLILETSVDAEYFSVAQTVSPEAPDPAGLRRAVETLFPVLDKIERIAIPQVEADLGKVREYLPERLARVPNAADRERIEENLKRDEEQFKVLRKQYEEQLAIVQALPGQIEAAGRESAAEIEAAREPLESAERALEAAQQSLESAESTEERQQALATFERAEEDLLLAKRGWATAWARLRLLSIEAGTTEERVERIVRGLQGLQVGLRTELIELNPFQMSESEAVGYALTNRVDLMNQRALVTDARRRTEVAANALQAVLDVRVEQEVRTRPLLQNDNPLDFRRDQSTFRAGIGFVAPLDQIAQRNSYRVAQISYQRARRAYMQSEDQVKLQIRQAWRQLVVFEQNFEVARNAIRINAQQYDLAVERATGPARGGAGGGGGGGGSGADQQGLNLINALQRLLQSQNQLIGIWVDYETARLNIYRDMGIMEIDARGLWVEPYYQNGLQMPEGDNIQGPPGWVNPASLLPGESDGSEAPGTIPPAPAPLGGVDKSSSGSQRRTAELKSKTLPSVSPTDQGVQTAAYSTPPSPSPRKAGHERTRQSPETGRTQSGHGTSAESTSKPRQPGWRKRAAEE